MKEKKENKIKEVNEDNVFNYIWDLCILMLITFIITFSVFPGAAISYKLL
jgi:hypothetical protein